MDQYTNQENNLEEMSSDLVDAMENLEIDCEICGECNLRDMTAYLQDTEDGENDIDCGHIICQDCQSKIAVTCDRDDDYFTVNTCVISQGITDEKRQIIENLEVICPHCEEVMCKNMSHHLEDTSSGEVGISCGSVECSNCESELEVECNHDEDGFSVQCSVSRLGVTPELRNSMENVKLSCPHCAASMEEDFSEFLEEVEEGTVGVDCGLVTCDECDNEFIVECDHYGTYFGVRCDLL